MTVAWMGGFQLYLLLNWMLQREDTKDLDVMKSGEFQDFRAKQLAEWSCIHCLWVEWELGVCLR